MTEQLSSMTAATPMAPRARDAIQAMAGYASARSLVGSNADMVFLDANECAFAPYVGARDLERYPEQQPSKLQAAICKWLDVSSQNLLIGRGADEAIECLYRAFCEPGSDNAIICPPTFAMYSQSALLHGVSVREAPLTPAFGLDVDAIARAADDRTKLVFVCSPNNPTANVMDRSTIAELCVAYDGKALIVVDETYIEYATADSMIPMVEQFANLVVLRTLSKSHAAAGVRCGVAVGRSDVIAMMRKVLAPYPLAVPVEQAVLPILTDANQARLQGLREELLARRDRVVADLSRCAEVVKIWPSDANFLLVTVKDADTLTKKCREAGIILRNQSHQPGLMNSVRISIGSDEEMAALLAVMRGESIATPMAGRTDRVIRKTNETAISVAVNLDKPGPIKINTGVGFYDHMLDQIAKHAGFALTLECEGDLHIDPHHTVEDCAIALGQAIRGALGNKRGIGRYGFCLPMDESLVNVALDMSGRFYLDFKADFPESHVGDLPTDMVEHVFYSLAENMQANLHIAVTGENTHHMVEACFKGFGRALRQSIRMDGNEMPSTKGSL